MTSIVLPGASPVTDAQVQVFTDEQSIQVITSLKLFLLKLTLS